MTSMFDPNDVGLDAAIALSARLVASENHVKFLRKDNARLRAALELIAAPMRPDGTYNRCREACEVIAQEALKGQP